MDYTVERYNDSSWETIATIGDNDRALRLIVFPAPVDAANLRITVTQTAHITKDSFLRINEIYPLFAKLWVAMTSSLLCSSSTLCRPLAIPRS